MTDRAPFALTRADLGKVPPELARKREAFHAQYCIEQQWPIDPARLSDEQRAEILNHPDYPRE